MTAYLYKNEKKSERGKKKYDKRNKIILMLHLSYHPKSEIKVEREFWFAKLNFRQ